jgi:hypothetical protein
MARTKKHWREMTTTQRAGALLTSLMQCGLLVAALADIRRRPASEINGSKRRWVAAAFINYIGPVAYFVFGRKRPEPREPEQLAA